MKHIQGRSIATLWAVLAVSVGSANLAAQQTGELRVRVLDAAGMAAEADVRVLGLGRVAHVAPGDAARFEDVPAGDYLVEAESARSGRGVGRAVVVAGEIVELEITVSLFFHGDDLVVSVGREGTQSELYSPTAVMRGIDLRSSAEASLGETLNGEAGVNSSYHGPGSSRPIIRGLGGDRVRVLEGGVGTGDASNTSPDHAPGVEAALADRIEIIRGPATLLYGSSAIGGVVNVEDGRVPEELPAHPITGSLMARGGTVANERNVTGRIDAAVGRMAVHASGLFRETDDYAIPGFAEADHDPSEPGAEEEIEGILPNSALQTYRFAAGLSYVGGSGFIGVAYSGYDSDYGIPGGHVEEGAGEEEGDVGIDLQQRRVDVETGWRFGGSVLKGIRGRFGLADYRHFEVITDEATGDQEIETQFFNNEWEARVEAQHSLGASTTGALGVQLRDREFEAIGEEAFVPPSAATQFSAFLFEEFDFGAVGLQAGARLETQSAENLESGFSRDDTGTSASLGLSFQIADPVALVVNGARSVKLPTSEELFSNGPHIATLQFEIGDTDLKQEVGYSLDAGFRLSSDRVHGEFSFFVNTFDQFVYQAFTGEEMDGLPVAQWTQSDASFVGYEAKADVEVFHAGEGHVVVDGFTDYVRAELTDDDQPLPRIPPLRYGVGLGYESPTWHGHAGVTRVTEQDRVTSFEEATEGYTMVDASVGYRLFGGRTVHDIVLTGTNLTDEEARSHTSFLKEFAPLPGREMRLTYQVSF